MLCCFRHFPPECCFCHAFEKLLLWKSVETPESMALFSAFSQKKENTSFLAQGSHNEMFETVNFRNPLGFHRPTGKLLANFSPFPLSPLLRKFAPLDRLDGKFSRSNDDGKLLGKTCSDFFISGLLNASPHASLDSNNSKAFQLS